MKTRNWKKPAALAFAATLVLAACGGDDDDDGATATTAAPADTEAGASDTTTASDDTATDDTATEDTATEDTATDETAAEGSGEYGLIDDVYVGPNDFTLDPADCPEDWDPMQGITDDQIKFFISLPKAGPFAGFG